MGLIPIICFSLAFIFLWAIVNHASLKKLQQTISDIQANLLEEIKEQNAVIKSIFKSSEKKTEGNNLLFEEVSSILAPQVSVINKNALIKSIKAHQQKIKQFQVGNPQLSDQHPELNQQTAQITNELNNLTDAIFSYNKLVEKAPTKFLARILGFNIIK
jgi:hypothetical protein